jgi:hypothetical protein
MSMLGSPLAEAAETAPSTMAAEMTTFVLIIVVMFHIRLG